MFEATDQQIGDWVQSVLPDTRISYAPPATAPADPTVSLYLMELRNAAPQREAQQRFDQVLLRYLISTSAEDTHAAHKMLGTLLFAAFGQPDYEVDLTPVPVEIWSALGSRPGPAFVLQIPVRQPRGSRDAPAVRGPLIVEQSPTASLNGIVLGPNDVPISDAGVEIVGLRGSTRTGRDGRFRFGLVPNGGKPLRVRVEARGRTVTVDTPESLAEEQLVIRFDPPGR